MSRAEVYITTGIHNVMGSTIIDIPWTPGARTPAVIRGQITQFKELKVAIPRKNYRTASLQMNLMSPELPQFYTTDDPHFDPYRNFLYIKWRSHIIFWGPIITKEVDFEASTITLNAKDQGARLEQNYFKIGDQAMDGANPGGSGLQFPFASTGHLEVGYNGLEMCLQAANKEEDTRIMTSDDLRYPAFIPLGIKMGANDFGSNDKQITISRGQEIWRTMLDLGDRTDGPLFELVPQDISDGNFFAALNVFGQFRNDLSSTVKFHYNTGLNNVRNLQPATGGGVLSEVNTVSNDKRWNVYSLDLQAGRDYGIWLSWTAVDWSINLNSTADDAKNSLGAVGDATLDAYAVPLIAVTVTLRRDDQVDETDQFFYIDDYKVADIVEVAGQKGPESFSGQYLIDQVRLEQTSDNTGEILQNIDVIPWVEAGSRSYYHTYTKSRPDNTSPS